jgi:hypothetical protein
MPPTTGEIVCHSPDTFVRCCFAYTMQFGLSERSGGLWQRGSVFTPGPSPGNPYTIQFSRYYQDYTTLTPQLQDDRLET